MPPSYETSYLVSVVQKCTSITTLKKARQLHALLLTTSPPSLHFPSPYLHNNLTSMYARCNSLLDAEKVFDKTPSRNVVSYNALISAYSRAPNHANLAFTLFSKMGFEYLRPNGATFTSLFQAACLAEDRLIGSLLHALVLKYGFLGDVCVQTSLLGMYSNCGDMESANEVFGCIDGKDVVAWNSTIFGNLRNDKIKEGLALFFDMVKCGVFPTSFTYSMVLNACGRVGNYGFGKVIHARIVVSNIVVDLPLQNALLDINLEKGVHAAEQVLLLNARDSGTHILLSNLYAATGRWEGVAEMRRKIRDLTMEKDPGLSWIEDKNDIHVFSSGDQLHPLVNDAQAELHRLQGNMIRSVTGDFVSSI
ncbi:hypothetical protein PTKIN_Ptkin08bG0171700 [Pterospermum kingtungense]